MNLTSIRVENVKRWTSAEIKLARGTVLYGANGSGKSAFLQAIQLGILGYVPGFPARIPVAEISGPGKTAAVELLDDAGWSVRREFAIGETGSTKQRILLGSKPAAKLEDAEIAIDARWGRLAVALDLSEFMSSSPDKQASAIFALSRAGVSGWDPAAFLRAALLGALRDQVGAEGADLVERVTPAGADPRASLERATGPAFAGALGALEAELARLARDSSDMQGGVLAVQERARGIARDARKARAESIQALAGLETEALGLAVAPEGVDLALGALEARNRLAGLREAMARAEGVGQERKRLESDLAEWRRKAASITAEDFEALKLAQEQARAAVAASETAIRAAREAREASVRDRRVWAAASAARAGAEKAHSGAQARNREAIEAAGRARDALAAAEVESGNASRDLKTADRRMRLATAAADKGRDEANRARAAADAGESCPLCRQDIPEAHRAAMRAEAARTAAILRGLEGEAEGAISGVKAAEKALHAAETEARDRMRARNAAEVELAASGEALRLSSIPADPGPEPALAPEAGTVDPALLTREIAARDAWQAAEAGDLAARRAAEYEERLRALPAVEAPAIEVLREAEAAVAQAEAAARGAAEADGLRAGIARRRKAAEDAVARADAAIAFGAGIARERDRILSETLGPVRDAIQAAMPAALLRGRKVYLGLVSGKAGKPELDMGLEAGATRATLRTLSGGERAAFLAGLAAAILGRAGVPLRVLLVEAAELDPAALDGVIATLDAFLADGRLSNAILATCRDPGAMIPQTWKTVAVEAL